MKYVISASYGNDSMAMLEWASRECLANVTVVYCDTGWGAPGWTDRVELGESVAKRKGFDVVRLSSIGMENLVRMKSGFPGNGRQFCTAFLKGLPFLQWIDDVDPAGRAIVMVGKRRAESEGRKDTPEFVQESEYHGGRILWHPLYAHTDSARDALLMLAGIEKLPHRSDECSPCVNANRDDLRRLSRCRIDKLRELENEIGKPMFRAGKHAGARGIDAVIEWAKYSPGQYMPGIGDLFEGDCGSPFGCGL
jgi:3'-phosphoadenosine 5'-phosphosulfate sulfotransferase (PAPS reductase)/FAD synthetase